MASPAILARFFVRTFGPRRTNFAVTKDMRSAILFLLSCASGAIAATLPALPAGEASECAAIPVAVVSDDVCTSPEIFMLDADGQRTTGFALTVSDDVPDKSWIQGAEPPAAFLAVSGFACIGLLSWRRRLAASLRRRPVYTIRQMA